MTSHRIPFISTNSANGGLQSTSVTGTENRQRRVWVEAVWKRQTCVIAPFSTRGRVLGELLPRHARLLRVIELSGLFRKLLGRCAWQLVVGGFVAQE
jgi:hypothetical protein